LSAGEKEIYSISLVWALAKASQKPLPIVIDTPLGRLDKVHRTNLLTHYFPYASKQVIILSTDEEIANEYREMIENKVSKEYLITDLNDNASIIEGYFHTIGEGVGSGRE
jgi:DNA sulfur modification protein DndD